MLLCLVLVSLVVVPVSRVVAPVSLVVPVSVSSHYLPMNPLVLNSGLRCEDVSLCKGFEVRRRGEPKSLTLCKGFEVRRRVSP